MVHSVQASFFFFFYKREELQIVLKKEELSFFHLLLLPALCGARNTFVSVSQGNVKCMNGFYRSNNTGEDCLLLCYNSNFASVSLICPYLQ